MKKLTIRRPDDMHVHLRGGDTLNKVLPFSHIFGRCVIMGNLPKPIVDATDVERYKTEILSQHPDFLPIMSIMLVNRTTPEIIAVAYEKDARVLKLIPGGDINKL